MSLAAGGGELELFFAESHGGTYLFNLQHLSGSGTRMGLPIQVATGSPHNPPAIAVTSDGTEIACCWEDYGLNPNPSGPPPPGQPSQLVLCNSVLVGGSDTDLAMDGGFIGWGYGPVTATNSGSTIVIYQQALYGLQQQWLYHAWGYSNGFGPKYVTTGWSVVPVPNGFDVFTSDGGQLDYTGDGLALQYGEIRPVPILGGGAGAFATASSGDLVGVVIHDGTTIASTVLSADAGTVSAVATLSSATEAPAQAVAAGMCADGEFGFAYAVTGGNIMFRKVRLDGTPTNGSSTLVANLGITATGLAIAPGDGGLLLAVETGEQIAVFGVACP